MLAKEPSSIAFLRFRCFRAASWDSVIRFEPAYALLGRDYIASHSGARITHGIL